jgi:hypothetical protein
MDFIKHFLLSGRLYETLNHIIWKAQDPGDWTEKTTEATSLGYKHVVFQKPWCSATEKSGVDCVRNIEKSSVVPT